jgi:hypothetical protein
MEILTKLYKGFGKLILDNIPEIIMVDLWNGQTEPFWGEENNFALPAVFIDMRALDIKTIGCNIQDLRMKTTFHVAVDSLQDTRMSRNIDYTISKIHTITTAIHKLFQGHQDEFFESAMVRTAIYPYEAATNILQIAQQYEYQVIDNSAVDVYHSIKIENISPEKGEKPFTGSNAFLVV